VRFGFKIDYERLNSSLPDPSYIRTEEEAFKDRCLGDYGSNYCDNCLLITINRMYNAPLILNLILSSLP
jgi:hypothetical protein